MAARYKKVLFDMDGTLVPMDIDRFARAYFGALAQKLAPHGYEPKRLIGSILAGTDAMVANDGTRTNEQVFWSVMRELYGDSITDDMPVFDEFYIQDFDALKADVGYNARARETVMRIKDAGVGVTLATNAVFPRIAMEKRVSWADIDPAVFDHITSYENTHHCKPDPAYYTEIAGIIAADPRDCLMVGNDAYEDGAASEVGMDVFILTDCLIDRRGEVERFPHGGFDVLDIFLKEAGL